MQVGSENLPIEVGSVKTEYNFIEKVIKRFVCPLDKPIVGVNWSTVFPFLRMLYVPEYPLF